MGKEDKQVCTDEQACIDDEFEFVTSKDVPQIQVFGILRVVRTMNLTYEQTLNQINSLPEIEEHRKFYDPALAFIRKNARVFGLDSWEVKNE